MAPEEIKKTVQGAYSKALENRSMQMHHSSNISDLFRDLKLYGRDAGIDFVSTNLDRIVQEAVRTAECKSAELALTTNGFGLAAVEGMADALRDLTALKVETTKWSVKLIWAQPNPGLV